MNPPADPALPASSKLYDAARGVHYEKPRLRGWGHLVSFEIALVVGTLVIVHARGSATTTAAAVYAGAVAALFGTSALYHRGHWGPNASARLQRLDHLMIICLIAGTATPAMVVCLHGTIRTVELSVLWTLAALAAIVRLVRMNAPERVVGVIYVGLGWTAGLAIPAVWIACRYRPGHLVDRRRVAVHRGRDRLPPQAPGSQPDAVRLPRGVPRLRQRRRGMPVRRDRLLRALSLRRCVPSACRCDHGRPVSRRAPG